MKPKQRKASWRDALGILCEIGFLAREGKAALSLQQMTSSLSGYGWQTHWLAGIVGLHPDEELARSLEQRATALPASKPAPLRKRGRPRKYSVSNFPTFWRARSSTSKRVLAKSGGISRNLRKRGRFRSKSGGNSIFKPLNPTH